MFHRKTSVIIVGIALGITVIAIISFLIRWGSISNFVFGFDPWKDWEFASILAGMPEAKLIEIMGQPESRSFRFHLSQYQGFEYEYARAETSDAIEWLYYRNGVDVTYAIGLGPRRIVVMTAEGGT